MHPSDGMWREFLDGESDVSVRRALTLHRQDCPDCQRAVAALDDGRRRVTELLDRLDAAVPVRSVAEVLNRPRARTSRPSLLVAAIVALCVVTAAGATVRAGLVQRAVHWLVGSTPQGVSPAQSTAPAVPAPASSTGVAFVPAGPVEIGFEQWPRKGEIEIAVREARDVSVTASSPTAYSVRRGRVVVANNDLAASYRIVLPRSVPVASVRVGNRVVFSKRGTVVSTRATRTGPDSYLLSFNIGANAP